MSNRVLLVLVLLMCASFAAVIGVMWSAISPAQGTRVAGDLRILREPPTPAEPVRSRLAPAPTRPDKTRRPSASHLDGPVAAPPARHQLAPAEQIEVPNEVQLAERTQAAADQASRHLDQMESRLKSQIRVLEKSRNSMLDELARELRDQPPAMAARNVSILDDDTAAMALHRLPPAFRRKVLTALGEPRAGRLMKLLNSLKDK